VQLGAHARQMRGLCSLPGSPCVVAASHPVKNASPDNMLPRGGGAFVAEVDGNLTITRQDTVVSLHWQGKFRGPDFEAMPFELLTIEAKGLVDRKGKPIPSVLASPITEHQQEIKEKAAHSDEDKLLLIMSVNAGASIKTLAQACEWYWASKDGSRRAHKSKAHGVLTRLQKDHLVEKKRDHWHLTEAGKKAVQSLKVED
jgi:hypothetical protein